MTFEALHKWVLYAVVVLGLAPIGLSGEVPLPFLVGTFGGVLASWFYDPPRQRLEARTRWWNLATVATFLVLAAFGWITGNYLLYAVIFALFMVVTRLYQSRSSRDVFQLYGLSFIAMIAGAVINPTLSFLFFFVGYVVLLVWGLILLHLQRDIESLNEAKAEAGERPADLAWRARGLITGRFLFGSSLLALGIFAASLVFFFFFPRLGMGFFFSQGRNAQSVSGFSDRIELGHFGTIKDNMRVVMRVEFPDDPEDEDRRLRMRGISFDHYDGRVWSKTTGEIQELRQQDLGTWVKPPAEGTYQRLPGARLRQRVYLEPLDMEQRMIFGQPRIMRLSVESPELNRLRLRRHQLRFFADGSGDLSTRVSNDVALRYLVDSRLQRPDPVELRSAAGEIPPAIAAMYLQLPERLEAGVGDLARQVTVGATAPFDQVVAIERHLVDQYGYSTEGGHDPTRPLESFLFDRKEGHCEYFASAMALMLRTLGVPARPANGFFGGVYNSFGRFYTVRQADAHSWVEVYFAGYGWVTFDPTPPGAVLVPAEGGVVGTLEEWFDSLRLQWYKWVVEYDLEKQIAFFRAVGEQLGSLQDFFPKPKGSARSRRAWSEGFKEWASRPATWIVLGLPILLLLLWRFGLLRRLWRALRALVRRRDGPVPAGAAGALYHRMLRALSRQGVGRRSQETPRELASRLSSAKYAAADSVERLTTAFEAARYAGREPQAESLDGLERDVDQVRRTRR